MQQCFDMLESVGRWSYSQKGVLCKKKRGALYIFSILKCTAKRHGKAFYAASIMRLLNWH